MSLLKACNGGNTAVDLTQGLVAHYLLNNNADDSFGTYDGTANGGVDFQGDVASFDGVDDDIITPYSLVDTDTVDKPFTLSIWYKRNGNSSHGTGVSGDRHPLIYAGQDSAIVDFNFDFTADMDTDTISGQICSGSYEHRIRCMDTPSGQDLSVGYHHYVISYDGSKLGSGIEIYCDGVKLTTTVTTQGTYVGMNVEPLVIGSALKNDTLSYRYANGSSSNARIYSEAKDQSFVTALFEEGYYPKPLPLPTTTGLIAHYPLTGTAEDATGNYDGTEVGNTYVDDAEFGSVAYFDGVNDYIDCGFELDESTDVTISFWAKKATDTGAFGISQRSYGTGINEGFYFIIVDNYLQYSRFGGVSTNSSTTSALRTTDFVNIAISISSNVGSFYVNGVLISSLDLGVNTGTTYTENLRIAMIKNSTDIYYNGSASNFRIYNKALTTTEITDIYNYEKNFRPIDIDDGLVAYYPLANNSMDNYYQEEDGADTTMSYDGLSGVFDGSTSVITITDLGGLPLGSADRAFSLWAKPTLSSIKTVLEYGNPSVGLKGFGIYIDVANNRIGVGISSANIFYTSPIPLTLNTYFNIVVVLDGATLNDLIFYVNNTRATTIQSSIAPTSILNTEVRNTTIGRNITGSNYFKGNISKVRPYNKAITAEQVAEIYKSEKGDFI